jgi:desulfoferrodoxin (superoxide reductase-like protein)
VNRRAWPESPDAAGQPAVNRRDWLRSALGAAAALAVAPRIASGLPAPPDHRLTLKVPILAEDPTAVPVEIVVDHPMERDHFIRSIELTLPTDPIPAKGTYRFTAGSGQARVAFPMRSGTGGMLRAAAECSRHGRFEVTQALRVAGDGCAAAPGPPDRSLAGRPRLRVVRPVRVGETIEVWARVAHDSDTGLVLRGGRYVQERPPFHLRQLQVFLDRRLVNDFRLTAALSASPVLRFPVKVTGPALLRAVFTDSDGRRWEATEPLAPTG